MHLFFEEHINNLETLITLNEEESHHAVKTLRYNINDSMHVTDGKGKLYKCRLIDYRNKKCFLKILAIENPKPKNYRIHIASALTKNIARIEYLIEKAVETGIDEFTPIIFKHSERTHFNNERCRKIAISAIKQSQQFYLPIINPVIEFSGFLNYIKTLETERFLAYQNADSHLKSKLIPEKNYIIMIGPEGDFSTEEIESAKNAAFELVNLGKNRLRTETAALLSCIIADLINT